MAKEIPKDVKEIFEKAIQNESEKAYEDVVKEEKIFIQVPGGGHLMSDFADLVGGILKDKNIVFFKPDVFEIVEVTEIEEEKEEGKKYLGFKTVTPVRFITLVERYAEPGNEKFSRNSGTYWEKKSFTKEVADITLASGNLQNKLPLIQRIFNVELPIIYQGDLTVPKSGYDPRFKSWLPPDAPKISDPDMPLDEAKCVIEELFSEFCFDTIQDKVNAIAAFITPYLRGLYSAFNVRTPIVFYKANRERAGKDYLAGVTGMLYEGKALQEPPISSNSFDGSESEELRKKFLSALRAGRTRLHFSNNKGNVNNAVLEAVSTAEVFSDRLLGRNDIITIDNEIEFSMSGNVGIHFSPDLAYRCLFVNLSLAMEDPNQRKFNRPDLHGYILENRSRILSALYALIKNWIESGKKPGSVPFASYPEWAAICGGVMEAAKWPNPCKSGIDMMAIGVDQETGDMKQFFELCYRYFHCITNPDTGEIISEKERIEWVKKQDISYLANTNEEGLFHYLDFTKRSDQIKFGLMFDKFIGRELSGITLFVKDSKARSSRKEFMFIKNAPKEKKNFELNTNNTDICHQPVTKSDGNVGNLGNVSTPPYIKNKKNILEGGTLPYYPSLPKMDTQPENRNELIDNDGNVGNEKYDESICHQPVTKSDGNVGNDKLSNETLNDKEELTTKEKFEAQRDSEELLQVACESLVKQQGYADEVGVVAKMQGYTALSNEEIIKMFNRHIEIGDLQNQGGAGQFIINKKWI